MWWGSEPDPGNSGGEGSKEPPQNQQLLDLQEQFEQQQTFIAQLKEMLRKTEQSSSVSREKVEEYASTLSEINARAKLSKIKRSEGRKNDSESSSSKTTSASASKKSAVVTPAKEKINLLRQQLEENRVKLAERDKNQKDVEVLVNQIKAQLDESQARINDPVVNIPKPETEPVTYSYTSESSKDDLLFAIKSKDENIIELNNKIQQLQANVLDLQENIKEKDSVIDARTKAITLLSENLSKKGKDTLDLLEDTKTQMRNMQQNFVTLESQMKEENVKLQSELLIKNNRIQELTELNNTLENNKIELQEKYEMSCNESKNKIEELTKINEELHNKIKEFEDTSKINPEKQETSTTTSPQKISKRRGSKKSKSKEPETKPKETVLEPLQSSETTHLTRIEELQKQIEELQSQLKESKSSQDISDSDEVSKLNKQLEEMNKNMIKMKAQHKAKLKELQKKSSPSELNDKLTNLESENVKLGQRVAELEDEKGNLQLRLVDYESNKEKEYIADLENKIEEQKMEIENHIRTITSLESQITISSNELSALRSELANMMHIENAQVCSEMTSVQLEEQLDKEVSQKKEIQDKYNEIVKENENLMEKIETLNKEKQELSAKLDQYMQENIDLIDRLEKLSAEKVSSAESIEIVDALTQQEKLEIEAYQKNLDFISDKQTDDHIDMENNADLNESVSKLNEETSELMEKIKLFTDERREVMEKMEHLNSKLEASEKERNDFKEKYNELCKEKDSLLSQIEMLTSENDDINVKLKLLQEKSNEQSQEELSEYRAIIENQKLQIASLQEEIWNKSDSEENSSSSNKLKELNESLNSQLRTLQAEYEALHVAHEATKENSEEIVHLKNQITTLESKLVESTEEITFLQEQIEINKTELITASEKLANSEKELENNNIKIELLEQEANDFNKTIEVLNMELGETQKTKDEKIAALYLQLSELKAIITESFQQLHQYEADMNKNSKTTEELRDKLDELNYKIVELEHLTELKNAEILTLKQEKDECENKIKNLEKELKEKNDSFTETCYQLKEKCKFLEHQIETNSGSIDDIKGPFETKIAELERKNKDQVDKMKKIAANLKKKSAMCQDLEGQLTEVKEKWENESKEKEKIINDQQIQITNNNTKVESLVQQLKEIDSELFEVQQKLDAKNIENQQLKENFELQIQSIIEQKNILENKLQDFENIEFERNKLQLDLIQYSSLKENMQRDLEEKNQHIQNLTLEFNVIKSESEQGSKQMVQSVMEELETMKIDHETSQNAMEAKIQEKDLYIENLEMENNKYKERIAKLEEGLSTIEERREQLEQKAIDLKIQLEEKSSVCEEVSQSEDLLERRLSALLAHDEIIEKKLKESTSENEALTEKIKLLSDENEALQQKLNEANVNLQNNVENVKKIKSLNKDIATFNKFTATLEIEIKKLHAEYKQKLSDKCNELETMETELNSQLQELHSERKNLLKKCEILEDKINAYVDSYQMLSDEMESIKDELSKTKQQLEKTDLEKQEQTETIRDLENKLSNVEHTSGDTDTLSLKTEIDRLQNVIHEKDIDIQNYQRQNMQLQMASFSAPSTASYFNAPHSDLDIISPPVTDNNKQTEILEQEMIELKNKLSSSENELIFAKNKIEELESKYKESQQEDMAQQQILQNELQEKVDLINNLQQELTKHQEMLVRKTAEEGVAEIITTATQTLSENTVQNVEPIWEEIFQKQNIPKSEATSNSGVEVTKEELLRKIKALEFMLFNIEKEKDDTLVQCHEFTNELARLIYEREKLIEDKPPRPIQSESDILSLESQIVSEVDNSNVQNLQALEFTPLQVQVNKEFCENIIPQPVVEDVIEPQKAYLCFTNDNKQGTEASGWNIEDSIDAQIIPLETVTKLEEPRNVNEDTFASEEDGWGWNAEEAKLEAEHRMSLSAAPSQIDQKVEQLEEKIHDLEVERSRLLEEIKSSQVRSGKLIKKLKLMKEKNDNLVAEANKKSSGDFCGLEMAIQDELNTQIKTLEKKIKELTEENSKDKSERDNLTKKLEVLTNANDRMIEMKEKQDNEIQFLQFKNRELLVKLEQLEWGDDSPNRSKTPTVLTSSSTEGDNSEEKKQVEEFSKKIAELNTIINDLTLDNEEMQCMLEEQRNMRLEAEKALSNRPVPENMKTEQEFLKVESENRNMHEELTKLIDVRHVLENKFSTAENDKKVLQDEIIQLNNLKQDLEESITRFIRDNTELSEKCHNLQLHNENLIQENQLLNRQYSEKIDQLQNENIVLQNQLANLNMESDIIARLQNENMHLQSQVSNLNTEKEALLKDQMESNQNEILQLKSEITKLEEEKRQLNNLLLEKEQNLQNFSAKILQLEEEKNSVEAKFQEILKIQSADKTNDEKLQQMNEQLMNTLSSLDVKNKEIVDLNNILSNERSEFEQKLSKTIEQLAQEWSEKVNQRGNDVAESWKLHLESVENEFTQKEENLRTELNAIFKQNEELISQNNTLQNQVQTLLSEKQTFVSDNNNTIENLQQSINSKQIEITELIQNVDNKEKEIIDLTNNMSNKEKEISDLTNNMTNKETEMLQLSQNIEMKESEIMELSQKLLESSSELQVKNSEIINLQLTFEEMQSKEIEYQNYIQQYAQQLQESTTRNNELEEKINVLNIQRQEEEKEITDLKNMIENQVLKIEDLKKEIEHKDKEYNALVAELETFESNFLRPETKSSDDDISETIDESEPKTANRAELDLALYMLHQRDVRCEELTVELMNLLEERDTLQLKLSNAIRLNEELKLKLNIHSEIEERKDDSPKSIKSTGAIPKSKSQAIVLGATGTELATEATENITTDAALQDSNELATKLSQLHSVGYNRDKTLKDDQEIRHIQQMTLMQQHRDLAAKLPPEAAARLVDASYTVSRDVQSPSKVLLNWLWGRSTPKVNDV